MSILGIISGNVIVKRCPGKGKNTAQSDSETESDDDSDDDSDDSDDESDDDKPEQADKCTQTTGPPVFEVDSVKKKK